MQSDLSANVQDWSRFDTPPLRDQEFYYRTSPTDDSTIARQLPVNIFEALMTAVPFEEEQPLLLERQQLREAVAEALESLSDEHRHILNAIHTERLSYAQLGRQLGVSKTHTHRLIGQAYAAAKARLSDHPIIQRRIMQPNSWEEAARLAVLSLAPIGIGNAMSDDDAMLTIERKVQLIRTAVNSQAAEEVIARPLITIGRCAASILANKGDWDVDAMVDLLCRKQNDYGHGNILAFGMVGVAVRASDKVARLFNLIDSGSAAKAEPLDDALLDLVGYAAIAHMLVARTFTLELENHAH